MKSVVTTVFLACVVAGTQPAPGPQTGHAVGYYDAALQRVMLIGGTEEPTSTIRDSVWSWSGTAWGLVTNSGPTGRYNGAAAFDPRRRIAIVSGGSQRTTAGTQFQVIAETWLGRADGWQLMNEAAFTARDHQSVVYDEARRRLLMFGGIAADRSVPWPTDTWQLDEKGWRQVATEGPSGRGRTALVYDSKRRQVVMFGGVGGAPNGQPQPFFNDTWTWDGVRWQQVATDGPRGRYAHGMVFDEKAGVALLYSGAAAHKNAPLTDMWQWDGKAWTEIKVSGETPGYRYQPVMVYDKRRGKTVLYGGDGSKNDTWEWDGDKWARVHP